MCACSEKDHFSWSTVFSMLLFRALVRPGRFDNQIHIHMPDARARHNILKIHAKKVKLAPG